MGFQVKVEMTGLQEVVKRLQYVELRTRKMAMRKAVTAGAQVLRDEAKSIVAVQTGLTRKSLGYRIKVYRDSGIVVGIVGPRTGFKRDVVVLGQRGAIVNTKKAMRLLAAGGQVETRNPTKTAHLLEFGTSKAPAHPFMRPAMAAAESEIIETMRQTIEEEILASLSGS